MSDKSTEQNEDQARGSAHQLLRVDEDRELGCLQLQGNCRTPAALP